MARNLGDNILSQPDIRAQIMELMATNTPKAEAGTPSAGTGMQIARDDHVHKRLTSATVGTTGANGKQTVMFTRTFDSQPVVMCDLIEAQDNGPVIFKVESFLDDTGAAWASGKPYGGAVIYGYRSRSLPSLTPLTVVTFVLTGVNALFALLSGYTPYVAAGSVGFSCLAIQQSP